MGLSIGSKRLIVMIMALTLTILAVLSISHFEDDVFCIVLNAFVILGSVFGVIGAYRLDVPHLGWFLIVLSLLGVCQAVYVILALVHHKSVNDFLYQLIILGVLFIGAGFTADLRTAQMGYQPILGSI